MILSDGTRLAQFTLNRDVATSRDNIELMGLDHPLIQDELGRCRSIPPEEIGIAVDGDEGQAVLLSFWLIEVSAGNGERSVVTQQIAVKEDGTRVPTIERQSERYLKSQTKTPRLLPEQRIELFKHFVEPALQHELKHKGTVIGVGSYAAELIGYVEL